MSTYFHPCSDCVHIHNKKSPYEFIGVRCDAFPEGIPKEHLAINVTTLSECANGFKYEPDMTLPWMKGREQG